MDLVDLVSRVIIEPWHGMQEVARNITMFEFLRRCWCTANAFRSYRWVQQVPCWKDGGSFFGSEQRSRNLHNNFLLIFLSTCLKMWHTKKTVQCQLSKNHRN